MRFQVVSNLYLDAIKGPNILRLCMKQLSVISSHKSDILVLAGNICACGNKTSLDLFELFLSGCREFRYVIHIPSNYEYYSDEYKSMEQIRREMMCLKATYSNYVFLDNDTFDICEDDMKLHFVGATWLKPPDIKCRMINTTTAIGSDRKLLRRLSVLDANKLYRESVLLTEEVLTQRADKTAILITHDKSDEECAGFDFVINGRDLCVNSQMLMEI